MRRYAPFFEVPDGCDRRLKEKSVAEEFVTALRKREDSRFGAPALSPRDPPDCVAPYEGGGVAALEITELVCEDAVLANEHGQEVYRIWKHPELLSELESRLAVKDQKTFLGGPFNRIVVVVHVDELDLVPGKAIDWISGHEFGPYKQIDEAYVLFSYRPESNGYPIVRLTLRRSGC